MHRDTDNNLKAIYIRTRETDDIFAFRGVASVDEIQPERALAKKKREIERGESGRLTGKETVRKIFTRGTTLALLLLAFTLATGGITTHQTLSYFNDFENATGNNLNAALLDFTVDAQNFSGDVTVGETGIQVDPATSGEGGSLNLEYKVKAEKISGPDTFCDALVAHAEGDLAFDGFLVALSAGPTVSVGAYIVDITLPDATGVVNGDVCVVDLVYTGWYVNAPDEQGYVDEERVTLTLTATGLPESLLQSFSQPLFDLFTPEEEGVEEEGSEEGSEGEDESSRFSRGSRGEQEDEDVGSDEEDKGESEGEESESESSQDESSSEEKSLIPEIPEIPNIETPEVPEIPALPEIPPPETPEPPPAETPELPPVDPVEPPQPPEGE